MCRRRIIDGMQISARGRAIRDTEAGSGISIARLSRVIEYRSEVS